MAEERESEPRELAAEARNRVRFEEEALELSDQVYRVARRLVSSREEAEDLVQETYSRAFRSWQSYTPGTNMRAWLLRILTNLNIDRGRRLQRQPEPQPLEEGDYFLYNRMEQAAGGGTDVERIDDRLSQDDIVSALSAVPHDFRDVIVLVDIGDFTYADAAQILDIPVGTVMSRLHRGRRILKRELAEKVEDSKTMGFGECNCDHCEEVMQPYPRPGADARGARGGRGASRPGCAYCGKRYRFEAELRVYVKTACREEMSPELKAKLVALRLPEA